MSDSSEPDQDLELDEDADIDVEHVAPTDNEDINPEDTASRPDSGGQNSDADCDVKGENDKSSKCNSFEEELGVEDENALGPEETETVKRALLRSASNSQFQAPNYNLCYAIDKYSITEFFHQTQCLNHVEGI